MSLIMDALNRADQERSHQSHSTGLSTGYNPIPEPEQSLNQKYFIVVIGIIFILALCTGLWQLNSNSSSISTNTPSTHQTDLPPATGKISTTPDQPTDNQQLQDKHPLITTEPEPGEITTARPQHKIIAPQLDKSAISELYNSKPKRALNNKTKNSSTSQEFIPDAELAANKTLSILQKIPLLAKKSSFFQDKIPSIEYSMHLYSDTENAGMVHLNGSMRRVGDEVTPELKLIAILKDSVVLEFQGTHFRLMALNSWVNYKQLD